MAGKSAHVAHLESLITELYAELSDLGTSVPNEPSAPIPIRGRPLYKAVQAVEQHYGGGLPIERSDKLAVDPRRVWKDMLLAADHGQGANDPAARDRMYYENCQSLLGWAMAELSRLQDDGPLSEGQAEVAKFIRDVGFASAKEIANRLGVDDATVRKHYIPPLKKRGLLNKKARGYYFPDSAKPPA
jgi:hypothetical protein